jgi:hypothetical protein
MLLAARGCILHQQREKQVYGGGGSGTSRSLLLCVY